MDCKVASSVGLGPKILWVCVKDTSVVAGYAAAHESNDLQCKHRLALYEERSRECALP